MSDTTRSTLQIAEAIQDERIQWKLRVGEKTFPLMITFAANGPDEVNVTFEGAILATVVDKALLFALNDLRARYVTLFDLYARPTYSGIADSDLSLALMTTDIALAKATAALAPRVAGETK